LEVNWGGGGGEKKKKKKKKKKSGQRPGCGRGDLKNRGDPHPEEDKRVRSPACIPMLKVCLKKRLKVGPEEPPTSRPGGAL